MLVSGHKQVFLQGNEVQVLIKHLHRWERVLVEKSCTHMQTPSYLGYLCDTVGLKGVSSQLLQKSARDR